MTTVDASQTVDEIVRNRAETRLVFLRHHVPLARMGQSSLAEVSVECGIDQAALVTELERAIHESEPFDVGGFEWDLRAGVVRVSPNLARILGTDDFSGLPGVLIERVHPDDRARVITLFASILAKPQAFSYEYRIVRPDGAIRLLSTRVEPIEDDAPLLVGTTWDITEQPACHALEGAPTSSLESALEATVDGILVVDRVGKAVMYNTRFLSMWRIPAAIAAMGSDAAMLDFVLDQLADATKFLADVQTLYANPERESFDELQFKDGRVFERYSRPQRARFAIIGRVWSFRDVTERQRLLARQTFLVDASRLLGSLDVDSALDAVAKAAVPYLGDSCTIEATVPSELRGGSSAIWQIDGASTLAVPLVVKDGPLGAIVITAHGRKHTRADLEVVEELARRVSLALENARLLHEAQQATRARDDFLSVAAHEIRGPLSSIHLAVQTLQRHELAPPARDKMLGLVVREDRRLARFVEDILDVTRIRTGTLRYEDADVDLAEVVRDVAQTLAIEIERSRSTLTIDAPAAVVGRWDRFRLEQVVTNLIQNALKFGLGKPIEVTARASEGEATLTVTDHGIGVPQDQCDAIFEPYKRAVSARHYGGLGLGLFIVRTIVTRYGGSVRVEPREGGGARFVVRLPLRSGAYTTT